MSGEEKDKDNDNSPQNKDNQKDTNPPILKLRDIRISEAEKERRKDEEDD